ncbi:MAG TPA: NblA/ycf18 family protein [Coleofasciculaceae cyanobacterium]
MEQQFRLRLVQESAQSLSYEEAQQVLVDATRLLMVKTNFLRNLMSKTPLDLDY